MAFELRSRWYRVAVAGDSIDGRVIEENEIKELAETYSTEYYTANIYEEHRREWGVYGQVVALKAETIQSQDQKLNGKLGLFAVLAPNQMLVGLNRLNQKIFTSIEIWPNFQNTGKSYLAGFAITDQPGSVGTEPLKFNANRTSFFTNAVDNDFNSYLKEFNNVPTTFFAQHPIKKPKDETDMLTPEQFEKFMAQQQEFNANVLKAVEAKKPEEETPPKDDETKQFSEMAGLVESLTEKVESLTDTVTKQAEAFSKLENEPFGFTTDTPDQDKDFVIT